MYLEVADQAGPSVSCVDTVDGSGSNRVPGTLEGREEPMTLQELAGIWKSQVKSWPVLACIGKVGVVV